MASFFQPAVLNPSEINGSTTVTANTTERFLVYSNTTLPHGKLLVNWWQHVTLIVGSVCLGITICKWSLGLLWVAWKRKRAARAREKAIDPAVAAPSPLPNIASVRTPDNVKTFGLISREIEGNPEYRYDLCIALLADGPFPDVSNLVEVESAEKQDTPRKTSQVFALLDRDDWDRFDESRSTLSGLVEGLLPVLNEKHFTGVVVPSEFFETNEVDQLLHMFAEKGVSCLYMKDADEPASRVNLSLTCGVIFKNACIQPDGTRRDFFRASNLRDGLARCTAQRESRPNFFVGFLDLWNVKPSAAVVRRSTKLTSFNGAVLHCGPAQRGPGLHGLQITRNCSSAFDWLKREDIIQVC